MRFCVHCGASLDGAARRFCIRCGRPRQTADPVQPPGRRGDGRVRVGSALLQGWLLCLMAVVLAGGIVALLVQKPSGPQVPQSLVVPRVTYSDPGADTGFPFPSDSPSDSSSTPEESSEPSDDSAPPSETPASPTPTVDAVESAGVGDCFRNTGSDKAPEMASADCGTGAFEVVRVLRGTTDPSGCDRVRGDIWNLSYSSYRMVLCLGYHYGASTAYEARQNDCVYGSSGKATWNRVSCGTGVFTVLARYTGTTDASKCKPWRGYDWAEYFNVPGHRVLDVLLCLSINYPDAIGHATVDNCLYAGGSANHLVFQHVSSCSQANVVVTGRTSTYNARSFCGNDGWATWRPDGYPSLAYTACFRWINR